MGVFLLLGVPRDSGRELDVFCHLSAAFIKIFDLSLKLRRRFPQVDVSCCLISDLLLSSPHYRFSSVTIRYDIRLPQIFTGSFDINSRYCSTFFPVKRDVSYSTFLIGGHTTSHSCTNS